MEVFALVHLPSHKLETAYGVAVDPSSLGSMEAHDGRDDMLRKVNEARSAEAFVRRAVGLPRYESILLFYNVLMTTFETLFVKQGR